MRLEPSLAAALLNGPFEHLSLFKPQWARSISAMPFDANLAIKNERD